MLESKSGRTAIEADTYIDVSGDADLCDVAGCRMEHYPYNVLASWHYELHNGELRVVQFSNPYDKQHRGEGRAQGPFYSGTNHRDVTRHVLDSRRLLRERLDEERRKNPGDAIYPFGLPSIPNIRVTRHLHNRFSFGERHRHWWLEGTVGVTGDWRCRGPIYCVTLRSIHADECPNLFVAGRCLSANYTIVDVTRAIGTCAVSGEACGADAAILVKDRIADRTVPLGKLPKSPTRAGALIHPSLLEPHPKAAEVAREGATK